ncbi:MAG: hypothetical protein R2816_10040 [Flavobacteriaceae bacterium]|nr:hypothetical protein [Flavobacteriaceae bacterium]
MLKNYYLCIGISALEQQSFVMGALNTNVQLLLDSILQGNGIGVFYLTVGM